MTPFARHRKRLDALQQRARALRPGSPDALAAAQLLDDLHAQARAWRMDYEHFHSLSLPEFKLLVDIKEQLFDELSSHWINPGSGHTHTDPSGTDAP